MSIYLYIATMALTTYLIRVLPLTIFRKPIKSRFLRSFLHYVPYACLTAMTFPAILTSTATVISGAAALLLERYPRAKPEEIRRMLLNMTEPTKGLLTEALLQEYL